MTQSRVARTVAKDKQSHPERYCKECLWKTAMVNRERNGYILNANPCPRHQLGGQDNGRVG